MYISHSNPYLCVTQRIDICSDPDLQILEVGTDLIPSFFLLNIYNKHNLASNCILSYAYSLPFAFLTDVLSLETSMHTMCYGTPR
jgi:hypothetical protein